MFKPTTFGKFFLYEKLAIGGMAEIFKAKLYGIAGFEKTLVVKQILPEYANDAEFVKMFIDEANIAVSLTHGNIVPVYELGKIADRYYIAMEFVDGENLETIVDQAAKLRREIPVHLCVEVCIEVCKGLDYAHRKASPEGTPLGIVHRDVSPQNVMVSFDGEVKIVDFGIAKAASKLSMTRIGTLKGKFGYMSPEQAMGNEVDRRTDVYAAGIVLYEILTGRKLYDADNDIELLKKVRAGLVPPPSAVHSRVPPELDRLVLKALAKDIGARYQFASEFQNDLQRWLYGRPADPTEETLSGWMRGIFRRDPRGANTTSNLPAAVAPPAPASVPHVVVEDEPDSQAETAARSRRDVSYARSAAIEKVLEDAGREARRVMGEEVSEDHTIPQVPPIVSGSISQSTGEVVEVSVEHAPWEDADEAEKTSSASYRSSTADDLIEFDETTSAVAKRLLASGSTEERPSVEGPIVRIPRGGKPAAPPPWQAGAIPAPVDDEKTRPGPSPASRGKKPGSKPKDLAAPSVAPEDGPLFQRSVTRPSAFRPGRILAIGFFALVAGAAVVVAARHGSFVPTITPKATPARTAVAARTPSAAPTATATPTMLAKESPRESVAAKESPRTTAVAMSSAAATTTAASATPAATPEPPTTRKASFETTPSGAAVYLGAKKLGVTPLTATVSADDVTVRYAKSGYRELKRTYPAAAIPLKAAESLEPIPTRTPPPVVEYGTVSVNATPWGRVKIDGVFVKNTPLVKHKVKAGSHEIEVANPDFPKRTQKKTVVVHANTDEDPIIVSFE